MNKISLVTGGTSGLGKEIVEQLIKKGQKVAIIARDKEKLNLLLSKYKENVLVYCGDICDEFYIKKTLDNIKDEGYYINYLFNNAGVGIFGAPEDMNMEKIQKVMNSNTIGLMCLTYETLRHMQEGGTIVNIMSTAAIKTPKGESLYSASKCAVKGFTNSLQLSYKNTNIHVIGVYPGGMKTPFWKPDCGQSPDVSKFMDPAEVAEIIIFNVLEHKTSYIPDITIERI